MVTSNIAILPLSCTSFVHWMSGWMELRQLCNGCIFGACCCSQVVADSDNRIVGLPVPDQDASITTRAVVRGGEPIQIQGPPQRQTKGPLRVSEEERGNKAQRPMMRPNALKGNDRIGHYKSITYWLTNRIWVRQQPLFVVDVLENLSLVEICFDVIHDFFTKALRKGYIWTDRLTDRRKSECGNSHLWWYMG